MEGTKYFIAYNYSNKKLGVSGFGSCEITLENPICGYDDIRRIASDIKNSQ